MHAKIYSIHLCIVRENQYYDNIVVIFLERWLALHRDCLKVDIIVHSKES